MAQSQPRLNSIGTAPSPPRWKIPYHRFKEFLHEQSNEEERIFKDSNQTHPPRYNRQVLPEQQSKQRLHICQNRKISVWTGAIRDHSAQSAQGKPQTLRI